ncbi:MAG: hypothetical protein A3F10_01200 [Coxiella sp. RIFCSPHIGHO2_12_FULL_42_15]|nr:MAG: hypothetical protein A3F10_01200 [Coxiella sp. RIFCSPHIGHO2_12_FULL_42_15]
MKWNALRFLSLGVLIVSSVTLDFAFAKESRKFPHGCREVGFDFSDGHLQLKMIAPDGLQQTLYFIHNKAPFDIALRNAQQSKYIPTYEKLFPQDRWASFGRDVDEIALTCTTPDNQFLNCGEVLEVCNYDNVKFPETNIGTYWVTNPGSLQETIQGSIRKGILLRW